jgi:hypothetical protein
MIQSVFSRLPIKRTLLCAAAFAQLSCTNRPSSRIDDETVSNRVPAREMFLLRTGYVGPFVAVYDQQNGVMPSWRGDTAMFTVPNDGILKIRNAEPPSLTKTQFAFANAPNTPFASYNSCADMRLRVPDGRIASCWIGFSIVGTGIPKHLVAVITQRDRLPRDFERTTFVYDSVVLGGKGKGIQHWEEPPSVRRSIRTQRPLGIVATWRNWL